MKILLDTHIALWAIADTAKLSDKVIQMLETGENEIYYSMASVWEVAIKHKIKPEQMPMPEEEFVRLCEKTGFVRLPIETEHILCEKLWSDRKTHQNITIRLTVCYWRRQNMKNCI